MVSRWEHLKLDALRMRTEGASIRDIEDKLGIARSTLSGWLREVVLLPKYKRRLENRHARALFAAREKAAIWHRAQKTKRVNDAKLYASDFLDSLDKNHHSHLELALAFLYFGEGAKTGTRTSLANSNSDILRFFVVTLEKLYGVTPEDIRCELYLRSDQKPEIEILHWSQVLRIPRKNFSKPTHDARTVGKPTFPGYHGVCAVRCTPVAIQRRLMYIATMFCDRIIATSRD